MEIRCHYEDSDGETVRAEGGGSIGGIATPSSMRGRNSSRMYRARPGPEESFGPSGEDSEEATGMVSMIEVQKTSCGGFTNVSIGTAWRRIGTD